MISSCTWQELATKSYPKNPQVVQQVNQYLPDVIRELDVYFDGTELATNVKIAMVVMACESKGNANAGHGGLYQFTSNTWKRYGKGSKNNPQANIKAMANLVSQSGWNAWAGGTTSSIGRWGSGPKGHKCWKFPTPK